MKQLVCQPVAVKELEQKHHSSLILSCDIIRLTDKLIAAGRSFCKLNKGLSNQKMITPVLYCEIYTFLLSSWNISHQLIL